MENQINNKEEQKLGRFDEIDFEELEEVFRQKEKKIKEKNRVISITIGIIFLIAVFSTMFFGYNFWTFIFFFSIFCFAPLYKRPQKEVINEIARRNNLQRLRSIPLSDLKANLFKVMWYKTINNVLVGMYKERKTRFFNYSYTVEHGRSSTTHYFTVLEVFFDNVSFPYMLLQYKRDLLFKSTRYGKKELDERKITLEDEFDKHYDLFVKDGYGVEAMQIFRDDFLNFLVEEKCNFSIELKEDRMYIYLKHIIRECNEFRELFTTAGETIDRVAPLLIKLERDFKVLKEHYNK